MICEIVPARVKVSAKIRRAPITGKYRSGTRSGLKAGDWSQKPTTDVSISIFDGFRDDS